MYAYENALSPAVWDLGEIGAMHACGQVEAWHTLGIRPLGSALCSAGDGDTKNTELSHAPGLALLCVPTVKLPALGVSASFEHKVCTEETQP